VPVDILFTGCAGQMVPRRQRGIWWEAVDRYLRPI